jgi:hypothetical protein
MPVKLPLIDEITPPAAFRINKTARAVATAFLAADAGVMLQTRIPSAPSVRK